MSELPKGWVGINLDKICDIIRGVTYKKEDAIDYSKMGYIPLYRANNIQNSKLIENELVYLPQSLVKESQLLKGGDIVVAMSSGSKSIVGKAAQYFSNEKKTFGAFCGTLRPIVSVQSKYVGYFTQTKYYRELLSSLSAGANINNLKPAFFGEINVPLAPFAEQTRIVEKLDEVLAQVDTIKARLDGIPAILKRFRQSVLAAAVSGRLTEEWRKNSSNIEVDLVSLNKDKNKLIENKLIKNDLSFEYAERMYDAPDSWAILKLKSVAKKITDGEHKTPIRQQSGRYLISARNVRDGYISLENVDYVDESEYQKLRQRCDPNKGDILISCSGSVGRVSLVDADDKYVMVRSAALVKLLDEYMLNYFLVYALQSPQLQKRIDESSKSTAQSNLFLGPIKELEVPLPPIEEQREIVRLVDQYFAFADTIEAQVKKAQTRVDNLTQSILAKAFRGELVAQDPDDEPAEKLLERIAQARKEAEALAKAAKKVTKTK